MDTSSSFTSIRSWSHFAPEGANPSDFHRKDNPVQAYRLSSRSCSTIRKQMNTEDKIYCPRNIRREKAETDVPAQDATTLPLLAPVLAEYGFLAPLTTRTVAVVLADTFSALAFVRAALAVLHAGPANIPRSVS